MECGRTCGIDRHKRLADRTLLFEYIYNTDVDLVNDNVYTKFGLILSIRSQDIA